MSSPSSPLELHDFQLSGHSHRVRLMMSLLALPFKSIPVDLGGGEHKRQPFLALNPQGQVPVLRDGDLVVADSNAILVYLATKYGSDSWLPRDPAGAAAVQRWLSLAAGEIAYGLASARSAILFGMPCDNLDAAVARGRAALAALNTALTASDFLTGPVPTIADIACYSYTAHAPDAHIGLEPYPQVRAWLSRVEGLEGFVSLVHTASA